MITLFTHSVQKLLESLSDILGCSKERIKDTVSELRIKSPQEVDLPSFFKSIGLNAMGNEAVYRLVVFDNVSIFHLSSRISEPSNKPLLNLHDVLTQDTDLHNLFLDYEVRFIKKGKKVVTYYKDTEVIWKKYSSYAVPRVQKRLLGINSLCDKCINGFLFNDRIWEDRDVQHLYKCPEIVSDISAILGIRDIENEWREKAKLYCIGINVRMKDLVFDKADKLSSKSKLYYTYRQSIYYLLKTMNEGWYPESDNPKIRIKDDININSEDIFNYYEVNSENR